MPDDGGPAAIAERLRLEAGASAHIGSPLYESLLNRMADDVESGGPALGVLTGQDEVEAVIGLRLMAALHRLVLSGRLPELAAHYPSAGGDGDPQAAWPPLRAALESHRDELRELVPRPLQTNEVGRSAALIGGFLELAARTGMPLRLLELGASAGLNLRWDRYFYEANGKPWGDPRSPVRFTDVYEAGQPPFAVSAEVAERAGCDARPLDPTSEEDRLTLRSCVWPDQQARFELLDAALEVAAQVPAPVERGDVLEWLEPRLASPARGVATVVYHSVVAQYLSHEARKRLRELIAEASRRAGESAPLAWLRMEPPADPEAARMAEVRLTVWPGGDDRQIARSGYHGRPVRWLSG